jgi:DoxX-like family
MSTSADHTEGGIGMTAITKTRSTSTRAIAYWIATGLLAAELIVGGIWDILRIPLARDVVVDLGYPTYLMVILGTWKLLGGAAILVPGYPVLKEWAYAGAFFVFSGAMASHLTTGKDLQELGVLAVALALVGASWALRPPNRRVSGTADRSVSGP